MKTFVLAAGVLAASTTMSLAGAVSVLQEFGTPGISGSVDVVETLNNGKGVYDVTNNSGGWLAGFGVSNVDTIAQVYNHDGLPSQAANGYSDQGGAFYYRAESVFASEWDIAIAYIDENSFTEHTFADLFGDFESVAGDDNVFNWYTAVDGAMQDGHSISGYFGFFGLNVNSSIIGIAANQNGAAAFTAGAAVAPGNTPPPVPLPAAGWMLLAGLGGLAAAKRRKN